LIWINNSIDSSSGTLQEMKNDEELPRVLVSYYRI